MINNDNALEKLSLPLMLISLPLTVMDVLLPMYTSVLGLTPLQVTGLISVFSLVLVIIRLSIGHIADKIGRKPVFLFGLLFYVLSYFIYSNAKTILLIYIGRTLQAIAAAFITISSYSMIADLNMKKNAYNFGIVNSYSEKGGLLGVILCFFILNTPNLIDGWSRLFMICTLATIMAVIYTSIYLMETKPLSNKDSQNLSLDNNKKYCLLLKISVRILTSMVYAIFVLYLQRKFSSDLLEIGIAFLLPTIVVAFASPELGRISDSYGNKRTFVVSLSMLIVSSLLLPFMGTIYFYGVVWTIYCITITLLELTLNGVYVEEIAESIRGIAIGKLTMAANVGTIIGPIIGGLAFQRISIKAPFFISSIGFAILLIVIIINKGND